MHPRSLRPLSCAAALALLLYPAAPRAAGAPSSGGPVSLTPPSPPEPRINGASVFGVRPGAPFFYAIPATGDRPMTFSAEGLPAGVTLDPKTGRMAGTFPKAGTVDLVLHAKNARGEAARKFRVVAGNEIALTPPMGWNSWYGWGEKVTQEKMLAAARLLVSTGLAQHGWNYVNIDDGWQGARSGPDLALQANEKFPDMKGLCDEVHGLGLRAGIYSTPWVRSYAGFTGGSALRPDGKSDRAEFPAAELVDDDVPVTDRKAKGWFLGPYPFCQADARQWAAWGFDYLKYDWNPILLPQVAAMEQALRATGRDVVLSLSNQAPLDGAAGYAAVAQSWRTTTDITDQWGSVRDIGFHQERWAPYARPGHWNDPDMLMLGRLNLGRSRPAGLKPDEQYTQVSLWCLLSAPLLISCDLAKLDAFTYGLLGNDEVIAVDQDPLGKEAVSVARDDAAKTVVYAKPLADGTRAVGLFNKGDAPATVRAPWAALGLTGSQPVRDLWRQKDLDPASDAFSAEVPAHGVVLVRIGVSTAN